MSETWTNRHHPALNALRNRKEHFTGKCANCRWLNVCGGGFRVRALQMTGDFWAPDPSCYLREEETLAQAA